MTPRCAIDLGYTLSDEDKQRPFIEVSGRKGYGVKADDLLDKLTAAAQAEVDTRHPELTDAERTGIAVQIAVGALRYFMLRFTRNTVIAFDFKDALSFEGETGPYVQYAIVRAANIFRKAGTTEEAALAAVAELDLSALASDDGTSLWETWLLASRLTALIEQAIATAEPAYLARYAFQLAQQFNNFYHRHHVLNEQDANRRALLLATAAVARREMVRALGYLGIEYKALWKPSSSLAMQLSSQHRCLRCSRWTCPQARMQHRSQRCCPDRTPCSRLRQHSSHLASSRLA